MNTIVIQLFILNITFEVNYNIAKFKLLLPIIITIIFSLLILLSLNSTH